MISKPLRLQSLNKLVAPYELVPTDPQYRKPRRNSSKSTKVLTSIPQGITLEGITKVIRKGNEMAKEKQTSFLKSGSLVLLTVAAVNGVTVLLGGQLTDFAVSVVLVTLLFVNAADLN